MIVQCGKNKVSRKKGNTLGGIQGLLLTTALLVSACGNDRSSSGDGSVDGVGGFQFSIESGSARLSVAFTGLNIDNGVRVPIFGRGESYIEIGPDFESGGSLFVAHASLKEIFGNRKNLLKWGLPDGRPIPGIRSRYLPARVLKLPLFGNSLLYQGKDIFGIFLPVSLPLHGINISVKMRDQFGNLLGVFTAVAKAGDETSSGALFLFPVDSADTESEFTNSEENKS